MKAKDLDKLGLPRDRELRQAASRTAKRMLKSGMERGALKARLKEIAAEPGPYLDDPDWAAYAQAAAALLPRQLPDGGTSSAHAGAKYAGLRSEPVPVAVFASEEAGPDPEAMKQMENAALLPIAVAGALMPDAHVGYGLPIGGVLAVEDAVIPYAVGMDIACRMRLSVVDAPVSWLTSKQPKLARALEQETRFGVGASFKERREHPVMDLDWDAISITKSLKNKAWEQLGTSGSGNHFAEFGALTVREEGLLGLEPGQYLALLTHSGSRGVGGEVARYFSRIAQQNMPQLPKHMRALAWFPLSSAEGRAYWAAMQLMGEYSHANHEILHAHVLRALGFQELAVVENHHNFAWIEEHFGRELVVHRKGATPAGPGALGVIPGSMADPGYVVRGKGNPESLHSAAHGAGRRMSRKEAKVRENRKHLEELLKEREVTLLSGGLDESPIAYKDIGAVMRAQKDLVDILATFQPSLVKMSAD
ncbi:RtcB family protein [Oceanidesulfovibrio indonesiensis]|uniref:3'-phosphate/5'-hydroxy nucleic acid ligase n=1 Tax=Oceanidesulfovibrio indonesiensis TaxID=54767 RepID=A0A7M3MBE8_9BACT|nr:RtcB family protein [Oceanidesulfovibrio indonesiensis]TVM15502.1 RtcB family protein [Oceanidesulfovibrio indonesiensis]